MYINPYADIHSHILYGVDDGAKDLATAEEMLRTAYEGGCRMLVFTPHYEAGRNHYERRLLEERFEELKLSAKVNYPELQLFLGNELLCEQGAADLAADGSVHSMGDSRYILIEFAFEIGYTELVTLVRALQQKRLRPIIAHVERFTCLVKHMDRIDELLEMGVYLQMNGRSMVTGGLFDEKKRWCRRLLKEQKIQFIGSDAHNTTSRSPQITDGQQWMEKNLDAAYFRAITWENAQKMITNQYL